jgi:hypothetical protein
MNYKFIFMLKVVMKFAIIASFMGRVFPIRELKSGFIGGGNHRGAFFGYSGFLHRGSQLYFLIIRYVLKEEKKVKIEFRHLFSLQKRFNHCSSNKINAHIIGRRIF